MIIRGNLLGKGSHVARLAILAAVAVAWPILAHAATKQIDLDGQSANGAESKCDLNVLSTFPVQIENVITNKALGDVFNFAWPSAGPGGFTSSVAAGTSGGVGTKWTWTTNQTVYSFTGSICDKDVCFLETAGPDFVTGTCTLACLDDGIVLTVAKGTNPGDVALSWSGGTGPYSIYRGTSAATLGDPANIVFSTSLLQDVDTPPSGTVFYYRIRGTNCNLRKSCTTNADCNPVTDGVCWDRGPFGVPGRSLISTDVTVSSASLTSSLITFFSPPVEVFRATSTAQPGAVLETLANGSTAPVTVATEGYPPGCCPANPLVPHQLRCGDACVDYLNDPNNCGACGNVCGDGTCCANGNCVSLCGEGRTWCDGQCVDFQNDNDNCGACGHVCGDGTCCSGGGCVSVCAEGQLWCNGLCADVRDDSNNCGSCDGVCASGTCCYTGICASLCATGTSWCDGQCADLADDSHNCGTCGNVCGDGTCCNGGACASVCPTGWTWCNGKCVNFQSDSGNCGACGAACGTATCCSGGACVSECGAGRTYCGGLCYDLQNDPSNCGACGHVCTGQSICTGGACVPCSGKAGAKYACDNRCVNLNTDPYNCGACGVSCNIGCPSGFTGVCSSGQSCSCVAGTPAPPPPSNIPPPTDPVCPNPVPTTPIAGSCPNPHPSPGPVDGVCPNPNPSPGPVLGVCPNPNLSSPVAGACPSAGPPAPPVTDTPTCQVDPSTTTIPPGGSVTTCRPGGALFKEVPTAVSVCGDTIPGPDGQCLDAISNVSSGTFMRLVPDDGKVVGNAYVTPYAVHVVSDTSNDGLLEPGESASLVIDVLNAGPLDITAARATLSASTVDLTDDGVNNPVGVTVVSGSSTYGTIPGATPSLDCTPPALQPASNQTAFQITVPPGHPGDTSHPFTLSFTGTVNGSPFSMDVPIDLGVAGTCDYTAAARDYDGLDGLLSPMAKLVPVGDPVPFPSKPFNAGNTRPLKLRMLCGGVNLRGPDVDAPQIVGLSEATRGPIDISSLNLNSDANSNDPYFRWYDSSQQWIYNMGTAQLGTGVFTITIRIASRKNYVTGFVLQ